MANIKSRDMQVFEILKEVSDLKSDNTKVELLQFKYSDHVPLQRILKMNFCDTIIPVIPEGAPPFNREKIDGPSKASLWSYINNFPYFVRSGVSAKVKPSQREKIFIEMLEAVDVEEADVIILAKDKQLQTKFKISADVVKRAFPQLKITTKVAPKVKTSEEKAADLLAQAEDLKAKAKEFNERAKELAAEAKKVVSA